MSKQRKEFAVDNATIIIAYYKGAYGPTLRIDLQSLNRLYDVKAAVEKLRSGTLRQFSLSELQSTIMKPPVSSVTLGVQLDREGPLAEKKIRCLSREDGSLTFDWTQTAPEWATTCARIDGLEETGRRGISAHQYLTDESFDDVLVELALNE